MQDFISNINILYLGAGIVVLLILLLIVSIWRLRVAQKQLERYRILMDQFGQGNLEHVLVNVQQEINRQAEDIRLAEERIQEIENQLPKMVQHVNLIRFKGFEDVGGDLSFSAAILNGEGDGMVITALHARDDTRIYAKKVNKYMSSYPLSEEEIAAIKHSTNR